VINIFTVGSYCKLEQVETAFLTCAMSDSEAL